MDLLCSERTEGANPAPGKMFLDFMSCLLLHQEGLVKQYDRRLTDAQYDAEHNAARSVRVSVDPEDSLTALSYMQRKFEEGIAKLDEVFLAQRSLHKIFGGADESTANPDVKASVQHLKNTVERILKFIPTAKEKVDFLSEFAVREMAKERELRSYLATVAGTLIVPLAMSLELAQVPYKLITDNSDKVVMGGGVMSVLFTLSFIVYDRFRKLKNPAL